MTFKQLDNAFIELWQHPAQLHTLLDKWQEMVAEYLAAAEQTEAFKAEYEQYLVRWQDTLAKNRALLLAEQQQLKSKLSIGEMKIDPAVIAKKFSAGQH